MNIEVNVQDIINNLKTTKMDDIPNTPQFEKYLITKALLFL